MTKERRIFEETYPVKKVTENPFIAVEAIGYLKHLKVTNPEQTPWIDKTISLLELAGTATLLFTKRYTVKADSGGATPPATLTTKVV